MRRLFIEKTTITPEINFSPDENIFTITGTSAPEDVRAMYYPVIEWLKIFIDDVLEGEQKQFTPDNPLKLQTNLEYFNSSSAKFFYDILIELKRMRIEGIPVIVEWFYDKEDIDQLEAGNDISLLVEMEFVFVPQKR